MAKIPMDYVRNYANSLEKLNKQAGDMFMQAFKKIDFSDFAKARDDLIILLETILSAFTTYSVVLAAQFYDGLRARSNEKSKFEAYAISDFDASPIEGNVRYLVGDVAKAVEKGKAEGDPQKYVSDAKVALGATIASRIDYEIKKAAGDCILDNVKRDPAKPRFARVPAGNDTCEFCVMLASQGFVYHTAETAGKHKHYHPNCRCQIVPGFNGLNSVDGYNPDAYYEQYRANEQARKDKGLETMSTNGSRLQRERRSAKR